jgi:hypothetical protein
MKMKGWYYQSYRHSLARRGIKTSVKPVFYMSGGLYEKALAKGEVVKFDPKQLAMGKKVEVEHTDNVKVALEIAKDHLTEDPEYYAKLERMEQGKCNMAAKGHFKLIPKHGRRGIPIYMRRGVPGERTEFGKKKNVIQVNPKSAFYARGFKKERVSPRMKVVYGVNKRTKKKEIQSVIVDTRRSVLTAPRKRKSLAEFYSIAPEMR